MVRKMTNGPIHGSVSQTGLCTHQIGICQMMVINGFLKRIYRQCLAEIDDCRIIGFYLHEVQAAFRIKRIVFRIFRNGFVQYIQLLIYLLLLSFFRSRPLFTSQQGHNSKK